jgi:hypothetical protein
VQSFEDLSSAASAVTASKKRISKTCLSKSNMFNNYYWSYSYFEPFVPEADLRKKIVLQYDLENNLLHSFESVAKASKITGVSKTCISRCCRGERESSVGFKWKYE